MKLIFCQCKYAGVLPDDVSQALLGRLKEGGRDFVCVDDLCAMAADKDTRLKDWARDENVIVLGCYARAVRWLFFLAGAELKPSARIFNLRTVSAEDIINSLAGEKLPRGSARIIAADKDPQAWFPVIDYQRCKNCRQCLSFCLFGVYELDDDGRVEVKRPLNCKYGCPACARVCPEGAIIFAKYAESPINGDEVDEETFRQGRKDVKGLIAAEIEKRMKLQGRDSAEAGRGGALLEFLKSRGGGAGGLQDE